MTYKIDYWDDVEKVQKQRDSTPEEDAQRAIDIAAAEVPVVPQEVDMWQAREILIEDGLLTPVLAFIAGIADDVARQKASSKFEFAPRVRRDDSLVTQIIPTLGKTESQIDDMFVRASKLQQ